MSYILSLRKKVGAMCLLMPCAAVIVLNDKKEILLQKRKDNQTWAIHGGSIELDETVEEAAIRELKEETGLQARSLKFFRIYSGQKNRFIYPNGDEVQTIDIVYLADQVEGELKPQEEEVLELRYFPLSALPEPIFESNRQILEDLQKTLK